jgi:hypothetical protein
VSSVGAIQKVGPLAVLDRLAVLFEPEGELRERALAAMISETRVYDLYLRGAVYCYTVEDASGETVDSCQGFYGYEFAEEAAKEALGYLLG